MSKETKKNMLSAEAILERKDGKTEVVYIEEWEGNITIRTLSAAESEIIENFVLSKKTKEGDMRNVTGFRETVITRCVVQEDGETPLFTPSQIKALMKKSANAVDKMFSAAMDLNGLSAKAQKGLEKN